MAHDLNLPTIADGQADGQWQSSNDGDAALGNALADIYTVDFSGGNVTLTAAQFRSAMTFMPSNLSATRDMTIPSVKRALFVFDNTDASDTVNVVHGSTSIAVAAGKVGVFNTTGAANNLRGVILTAGSGGISSGSTTTQVLTGTDTTTAATPDALAALWEKGSDIASAATITIGEGGYHHVTGTTTITDIDWATAKDGRWAWLIFDGALTLTHHATTLKLPGGANITTAAGDRALFVQDASDNVICLAYVRAAGSVDNIGSSRQIISGAGLTGGGDLSADRTLAVGAGTGIVANADDVAIDKASDANVRASASNKVLTSDLIESASAEVALTDAATVAVDWDAGINFTVTLGGNRTLGNPTNGQPGTWRTVAVTQDGTGSRTLAYDTQYKFPGGTEPVLTTTAAAVDFLNIYCKSATSFYVFSALDMKQ